MFGLGPWELGIILVIVLLIFGIGRVGRLGGELGKSISAFRKGLKDGMDEDENAEGEEKSADA